MLQMQMAAALREHLARPEWMPEERFDVYRRLLFNTVEGMLARAFPVVRSLTPQADWRECVAAFHHQLRTDEPQLRKLPRQFVEWLEQRGEGAPDWWPELCRYELTELELANDDSTFDPSPADISSCDIDGLHWRQSPLMRLMHFRWPVHRIDTAFVENDNAPESTWLVVWRDRTDSTRFMKVNDATASIIGQLDTAHTLPQLLTLFGSDGAAPGLAASLGQLLKDLSEKDVLMTSTAAPPMCEPGHR